MELEMLKLAREYQRKKEWEKAIKYYDEYIKKNGEVKAAIYIAYSKCLRYAGDINRAEKVLRKAKNSHPENQRILKKLIRLYRIKNENVNANSIAKELVTIAPRNSRNYFTLGSTFASLNKIEEAKENYILGLEHKHAMTMEALINKVQSGFVIDEEVISSEYVFISGRSNYGSLIHTYKGKRYFTKISKYSTLAKREEIFYREISEGFPKLKEYIPNYIDSVIIDNISYLTIELIDSQPTNFENIVDVIDVSRKVSSLPYKELIKEHPNPNYSFQLKNKPNPVTIFFTQIHKRYYNEKLFSSLYNLIKQNRYPNSIGNIIERLESLIMDNFLYKYIKPEQHYSLLHGDFNRSNIRVDLLSKSVKVIDWETFKVGLHFMDIVRYFSGLLIPYSDVKKVYLNDNKINGNLTIIEKIFFVYALILLYLLTIRERNIAKNIDKYLTPAMNDLESMVKEFKENEYELVVQTLISDKDSLAKQNEKLKEERETLKAEGEKLKATIEEMANSKSWRLTAPLRKIVQKYKGGN